jgi:hypothetical protein
MYGQLIRTSSVARQLGIRIAAAVMLVDHGAGDRRPGDRPRTGVSVTGRSAWAGPVPLGTVYV